MQAPGSYYFQNDTELEKLIIRYSENFFFVLSGQQILFPLSLNHGCVMSKPNYPKIN